MRASEKRQADLVARSKLETDIWDVIRKHNLDTFNVAHLLIQMSNGLISRALTPKDDDNEDV